MKRKTSKLPTRIYSYRCYAPTENTEKVEEQFGKARAYRNKLIEIELLRRKEYRQIVDTVGDVSALSAEAKRLEAELEVVKLEHKSARKEARRRVPMSDIARARMNKLLEDLKVARAALRAEKAKAKADTGIAEQLKALQESSNERIRNAREVCGVYWGTYLLVEAAMQQSRTNASEDPTFKRWDGSGRLGVQIQKSKKLSASQLFGVDTRLRVDPLPEAEALSRRKQLRRQTTVHLRIGSDAQGGPIWGSFPVMWHRPLPPDADIKGAWIARHREGHRMKYELQIIFESAHVARSTPIGEGACGIDIGWRQKEKDELRIGYIQDDLGRSEELRLPSVFKEAADQLDSLRSIRDRNFNEIRTAFVGWLNTHDVPESCSQRFAYLPLWKSTQKFMRAVFSWRDDRFEGDEHIFGACHAAARQEWHLSETEMNRRARVQRRKVDYYRVLADTIARRYAIVRMEKFDLRVFAVKPKPESGKEMAPQAQRHNRHVAGLSVFRDALKHACASNGAKYVEVDARNTTRDCAACGHTNEVGEELHFTCVNCGKVWDQDVNAAINIHQR